ncbi:hypothetical protein BDN67DRAFT_1005403, partial [Paxillus ammoniavirescens]
MFQQCLSLKRLRRRHANPAQSPPQMEEDSINHTPPAPSPPDDPGVSGHSTLPEDRRLVITKIKATNLFTGLGQIPPGLEQITSGLQYLSASLRQIPAGFYVNILVENEEYQTANKPALVHGGMTEWEDHIYLPSDLSSIVELRIYASPELGPMLGRGELLQKFSLSVGDLVQRSKTSRQDRKVVSSWSSLQVTAKLLSPQDTNAITFCSPVSAEPDEARAVAEATDIGHAHMLRYYKDANESHIREAVMHFRRVVDRCPPNHSARGAALSNLAAAKFISSQATDAHLDLDMAIFLFQDTRDLRPRDHRDHASTLLKLAIALLSRFNKRRDAADSDEAQELLDSVLATCSAVSLEYRSAVLVAHTRSIHSGANDVVDPNAAAAFSSTQPAYLQSPPLFDELNSKLEQCQQRDDPQLLDDVISQHRDAQSFYVSGQPDWVVWKCNLAIALKLRFERQGRKQDLEEAILSCRHVLSWTPRAHTKHCRALTYLASELDTRFEQGGDRKDLEEAIQHHRDALVLRPPGHPGRSISLNNIANALLTRFEQGGDRKDLEEAIQHHRDALVLTPLGHPDRSMLLNNIASALLRRFEQGGDRKDLEEALHLCHIAKAETPLIHPTQVNILNTSANVYLCHYQAYSKEEHLHSAMDFFNAATALASGNLLLRLRFCMPWILHAESHHHSSALDAYERSLQLLDSHLAATASIPTRHQARMVLPANLAVDAASCALHCGDICRALELLEQGRTTLWTQMARFHTPLSQLASGDPHADTLVQRFQSLSLMLNQQPPNGSSTTNSSRLTVEAEAGQYRHLVDEWNQVVSQIRTIEGFSQFLLPPSFSDLQEASSEGPIIVLIASKFSCDAVIVLHKQSPIHICLGTTLETLSMLTNQFRKEIFGLKEEYPRFASNHQQNESLNAEFMHKQSEVLAETLHGLNLQSKSQISNGMAKVLQYLWATVVSPVVIELEKVSVEKDSRIWWCPSSVFTALPLHAAGPYRKGQRNLEHHYISSYTPSLSTLIKARKMRDTSSSVSPHFAAIVQAQPAKHQTALY